MDDPQSLPHLDEKFWRQFFFLFCFLLPGCVQEVGVGVGGDPHLDGDSSLSSNRAQIERTKEKSLIKHQKKAFLSFT